MFDKLKKGLREKEFRVFLIFLFFSTLMWFMTKLSNSFEGNAVFNLTYENVPENMMLMQASEDDVALQLDALGFQFLGMSISRKNAKIDLSEIKTTNNISYLLKSELEKQIDKQLPSSMKLLEVNMDTLFFDIQEVITKKVPVKSRAHISFVQNYALSGLLNIEPDSVEIVGPRNQIDSIEIVVTKKADLTDLTDDFSKKINLHISEELTRAKFSTSKVEVSGKVSKFSEKKITISIDAVNTPRDKSIKMFPETVEVICLGSLEALKELNVSDFQVVADYDKIDDRKQRRIPLVVKKQPADLYSVTLGKKDVEFVLKRK